ncbi:MAG: hypothetical protein LBC41_16595 [Clostridiales bacterium]|jgi:hypothetical protein|nr:hypothetical protein [Clostridiales bacterium]
MQNKKSRNMGIVIAAIAFALAIMTYGIVRLVAGATVNIADSQLPIDPVTGDAIFPEADGVDLNTQDLSIHGQLPVDPKTGKFIWPEADGTDEGDQLAQEQDDSYNFASSGFSKGFYLKNGELFDIKGIPYFTNIKQSSLASDSSCAIAYQIINNSTGEVSSIAETGTWADKSTTLVGFSTPIAKGECKVYLAGQDTLKKVSGTFTFTDETYLR